MDSLEFLKSKGVTAEEIASRTARKKEEFSGLLTDEGALELVAREHGFLPKKEPAFNPVKLAAAPAGSSADFVARVFNVFAPKEFDTGQRKGRVCNIAVADETREAVLVLWNKDVDLVEKGAIQRNDVVRVRNAFVKTIEPLELHSRLTTEITVSSDIPSLPKNVVPLAQISGLKDGVETDFFGRVLQKNSLNSFERDGRTGFVLRLVMADESGQIPVVFWDRNAVLADRAKIGDALKVEGAVMKNGEAGVSWKGRVILNPRNHSLKNREELYEKNYARKTIREASSFAKECLIEATVSKVFDARVTKKCPKCGKDCGGACGAPLRELLLVAAELEDASGKMRAAFFGEQALHFLGLSELTLDAETVLSLKRDYLAGKKIKLIALPKPNPFTNQVELVARHVLSVA